MAKPLLSKQNTKLFWKKKKNTKLSLSTLGSQKPINSRVCCIYILNSLARLYIQLTHCGVYLFVTIECYFWALLALNDLFRYCLLIIKWRCVCMHLGTWSKLVTHKLISQMLKSKVSMKGCDLTPIHSQLRLIIC